MDVFQFFELDAIASDRGFTNGAAVSISEVFFVLDAHDVDGNAFGVSTDAYLVEFSGFSIGIRDKLAAVAYVGVSNHLAGLIFTIQKMQGALRQKF